MKQLPQPAIIVVEDDPIMGWMLATTLEQLAPMYPIQLCHTGLDALEYVKAHPVCGVVTDYAMPMMDGITLGEHLAATWPTIPVLLISGMPYATVQRQVHTRPTNFVATLEKPFALADMRDALKLLLAASNLAGTVKS